MDKSPTHVSTAPPPPTTPMTASVDTAATAASSTVQRIDDFIKSKLSAAHSAEASGVLDSAARAARLGFGNAANVRYSKFLEAFRSSPHLTRTYQDRYPNSLFLPWTALHAVIGALDLWVELPEFYRGAVPDEQLPWMEIFELEDEDRITPSDLDGMLPGIDTEVSRIFQHAIRQQFHNALVASSLSAWPMGGVQQQRIIQAGRLARPVHDLWGPARESFFVVAPPEAFSTNEDFLSRMRRLVATAVEKPTIPPNDPLVIRFCRGGCLVVAAWGDEAAALNDIARELKL